MRSTRFLSTCLCAGLAAFFSTPAQAQINPDQTLGSESSVVTPNVNVRGELADLIEGGTAWGSNLFHSFSNFDVSASERVYFANPDSIDSILSRVTGDSVSNISGLLGVDGAADLFFINPNGIVFGPESQLDIDGSFYASTASAIALGEEQFSAIAPNNNPFISIRPNTSFFRYLSTESGDITNSGKLTVGEHLTLAGNNLILSGGLLASGDLSLIAADTIRIRDFETGPFVALSGNNLLLQGEQQIDIFALNHPDSELFSYGDMTLRSAQAVNGDAHYFSGGSFRIEQLDNTPGTLLSPDDPIIRAFGDVTFANYQGSSLHILAGGRVKIGSANITGPEAGTLGDDFLQASIELSDGTTVEIDGSARPTLDIRAGVSPSAIGSLPSTNPSGLDLFTDFFADNLFQPMTPDITAEPSSADVEVGDVAINFQRGQVFLTNQYSPNAELSGDIKITDQGPLGLGINTTDIFGGAGGDVVIDSRNNIALINSTIRTQGLAGAGGNITLIAEETVSAQNPTFGLFRGLDATGSQQSGNIRIVSDNLAFNGAQMSASSRGQGNAGNITLDVDKTIFLSDFSTITSDVNGGPGSGGLIKISSANLNILNGSRVGSTVSGMGNAGTVDIDVEDTVSIIASDGLLGLGGISSNLATGTGNGGTISIRAARLQLSQGAQIDTSTFSEGNAGNIELEITDELQLDGLGTGIISSVSSRGAGAGGNINVTTNRLQMTNGAQFTTSSFGAGNAGNIVLNVTDSANLNSLSRLNSSTENNAEGQGGNLQFTARNLTVTGGAELSSRSLGIGDAGNITLTIAERLSLDDGSISTNARSNSGGSIQIDAGSVVLMNDSDINTFVSEGQDTSGNITVIADAVVALDDSDILAFAVQGRGGAIDLSETTLFAQDFEFSPPGINPQTLDGNGRVNINASGLLSSGDISLPAVNVISNDLVELADGLLSTDTLVASACVSRSANASGQLTLLAGDRFSTPLDALAEGHYAVGTVDSIPADTTETTSEHNYISEPRAVYRSTDGRLLMSRECDS